MKPPPFAYARAGSVQEAVDLLAGRDGKSQVLAGGQSLVPLMALRRARPDVLVDVNEIPGLDTHAVDAGDLVIGATCRQHVLERHSPPGAQWRALPLAIREVGNHATRMRGTVVGSIAHADPAGELPLLFLLFDGELTARSARGERTLAASDYFAGPYETNLVADELVLQVRLRTPPSDAVTAFAELNERVAVASVAMGVAVREGRCEWCRIVLGGVAPTPIRADEAEAMLTGTELGTATVADAARAAAAACSPPGDTHGSARYRRALIETFVRRLAARLVVDGSTP